MEMTSVVLCLLAGVSVAGGITNLWRNRWQRYVDPDAGGWRSADVGAAPPA